MEEQYQELLKRHDAFRKLVFSMREAQKHYFKYRGPVSLESAKSMEYKVDKALKEPAMPPAVQQDIKFEG